MSDDMEIVQNNNMEIVVNGSQKSEEKQFNEKEYYKQLQSMVSMVFLKKLNITTKGKTKIINGIKVPYIVWSNSEILERMVDLNESDEFICDLGQYTLRNDIIKFIKESMMVYIDFFTKNYASIVEQTEKHRRDAENEQNQDNQSSSSVSAIQKKKNYNTSIEDRAYDCLGKHFITGLDTYRFKLFEKCKQHHIMMMVIQFMNFLGLQLQVMIVAKHCATTFKNMCNIINCQADKKNYLEKLTMLNASVYDEDDQAANEKIKNGKIEKIQQKITKLNEMFQNAKEKLLLNNVDIDGVRIDDINQIIAALDGRVSHPADEPQQTIPPEAIEEIKQKFPFLRPPAEYPIPEKNDDDEEFDPNDNDVFYEGQYTFINTDYVTIQTDEDDTSEQSS